MLPWYDGQRVSQNACKLCTYCPRAVTLLVAGVRVSDSAMKAINLDYVPSNTVSNPSLKFVGDMCCER